MCSIRCALCEATKDLQARYAMFRDKIDVARMEHINEVMVRARYTYVEARFLEILALSKRDMGAAQTQIDVLVKQFRP